MNKATVIEYDHSRGIASVKLEDGRNAKLHIAGLYGCRSSQYPSVGDRLIVEFGYKDNIVAARKELENTEYMVVPERKLWWLNFFMLDKEKKTE